MIPFLNHLSRNHNQRVDVAQELELTARQTRLAQVDGASAIPRPTSVGRYYTEEESDQRAAEQVKIWAAEGERAARTSAVTAAGSEVMRAATKDLLTANKSVVDAARDRFGTTEKLLGPFVVRRAKSDIGYKVRFGGLILGDVAGLGGAAITYGEEPGLAIAQAVSASVATVTAGMVGAQHRAMQLAAERQLDGDNLPEALLPYRGLLVGPPLGRSFIRLATIVGTFIAVMIVIGIAALRSSVEGSVSGFVFGGIAAAIAGASWINSYMHADPVADAIEAARHRYKRELADHTGLASGRRFRHSEEAAKKAASIQLEYEHRGKAAEARLFALKHLALQQSPEVVGHGYAAASIGSKPRTNGKGRS